MSPAESAAATRAPPRVLPAPTPRHGRRLCLDLAPADDHLRASDSIAPSRTSTAAAPRPRITRAALAACRGRAVPTASWPALALAPASTPAPPPPPTPAPCPAPAPSPVYAAGPGAEARAGVRPGPAADAAPEADAEVEAEAEAEDARRKRVLLPRVTALFPPHSPPPPPDRHDALVPLKVDIVGRILAPPALSLPPTLRARPQAPAAHAAADGTATTTSTSSSTAPSSPPPAPKPSAEPELEYPLSITLGGACGPFLPRTRRVASCAASLHSFPSSGHGPMLRWPAEADPVREHSLAQHHARLANISAWLAGSDDDDSPSPARGRRTCPATGATGTRGKSAVAQSLHRPDEPAPSKRRKLDRKRPPSPQPHPAASPFEPSADAAPHPMVARVLSRRAWNATAERIQVDRPARCQYSRACTPRPSAAQRQFRSQSALRRRGVPPRTPMGRDRYVVYERPTPLPLTLGRRSRSTSHAVWGEMDSESESDLSLLHSDEESQAGDCFCGLPDDVRPMVMCDGCQRWVHQACVGFHRKDYIDTPWYCQGCSARAERKHYKAAPVSARSHGSTVAPRGITATPGSVPMSTSVSMSGASRTGPASSSRRTHRPTQAQSPTSPSLPSWMPSAPWSASYSPATPSFLRTTGAFMEESDLRSLPGPEDKSRLSPAPASTVGRMPQSPGSPLARKATATLPALLGSSPLDGQASALGPLGPPLTPTPRSFRGPIYTAHARARALIGHGDAADLPMGCGLLGEEDTQSAAHALTSLADDWAQSPQTKALWESAGTGLETTPCGKLSASLTRNLTAGRSNAACCGTDELLDETAEVHDMDFAPDLFSTPSRLPRDRPALWTDSSPSTVRATGGKTLTYTPTPGRWPLARTPSRRTPLRGNGIGSSAFLSTPMSMWPPSGSSIRTPRRTGSNACTKGPSLPTTAPGAPAARPLRPSSAHSSTSAAPWASLRAFAGSRSPPTSLLSAGTERRTTSPSLPPPPPPKRRSTTPTAYTGADTDAYRSGLASSRSRPRSGSAFTSGPSSSPSSLSLSSPSSSSSPAYPLSASLALSRRVELEIGSVSGGGSGSGSGLARAHHAGTAHHMASSPATSLPGVPSSAVSRPPLAMSMSKADPDDDDDDDDNNMGDDAEGHLHHHHHAWLLASPSASAGRRISARVRTHSKSRSGSPLPSRSSSPSSKHGHSRSNPHPHSSHVHVHVHSPGLPTLPSTWTSHMALAQLNRS